MFIILDQKTKGTDFQLVPNIPFFLWLSHYSTLCAYQGFGGISNSPPLSYWTILLYYELKKNIVMTSKQTQQFSLVQTGCHTAVHPHLRELTAALLIRGIAAVDDLVAPGWAGYAAPILARRFRRAARDVCGGEGGRGGVVFAFQTDNGSSTRRQSQLQLRTILRTSFRGRLKLAQGWKLPDSERPEMSGISAVK